MRPTVLLAETIHEDGLRLLERDAVVMRLPAASPEALREAIPDADGLIVRLLRVGEDALERASRLRVVGRHGVGVDNIAVEACTRRGIPVVFLPRVNSQAVAEHTVALLLALAKRLLFFDPATRAGRFGVRLEVQTVELEGTRMGIVGVGDIGRRVARTCHALGMQILGFDPYLPPDRRPDWIHWTAALDELLQEADAISLHVPLTPETRHLIGARELAMMKPRALLVNTARGAIVDEVALVQALQEQRIAGAGLDVYESEPVAPDSPLLRLPNVVLTPHVSAHTAETLRRMAVLIAEEVLAALARNRPRWLANPEVLLRLPGDRP